MLINIKVAVQKHGMKINGVIHVGAHHGQEYDDYVAIDALPVLFIEPCQKAFAVLCNKFKYHDVEHVRLFQSACGSEFSISQMNVEQANNGMSNSLLRPIRHLQQYPNIQFTETEEVEVRRLDEIIEHLEFKGNFLVMDVQGYELEVLKGATETLKGINYIYTEINRDEVYEGCARVEQLDQHLTDFTRVETSWAGGTWGDAIYKRKGI